MRGQALITLLFFMIIAIAIISTAVAVTIVNSQSSSEQTSANQAYTAAENGAEDAIIKLLRNPEYLGESLTVSDATITTQITGTNPKTITSIADQNGFIRKIQVNVDYTNNILRVISWKEVP